ncbi:MAG: type II and III secretion system protein [Bacteroidota bacterium]|nr:type II and III secretion system protein [Bacteroidota bacterium]
MMRAATFPLLILTLLVGTARPQDTPPMREYTPPEEIIAMTGDTPFLKAMQIFSNAFKRFASKPLVYDEAIVGGTLTGKAQESRTIGINIPHMHWRDAFDLVLRVNNYWYVENPDYVRLYSLTIGKGDTLDLDAAQAASTREVEISAIFFEANRSQMQQLGINWEFLNSAPSMTTDINVVNVEIGSNSSSTNTTNTSNSSQESATEYGMIAQLSPLWRNGRTNIHAILKALESENLGEMISSPSITVRSGETGRIHVGQDFSVKQRDYSGNTTEKFYSAGTIIDVVPTIMKKDTMEFVHLKISAERSSVIPDPISTIVNKTLANTSVILIDGEETVVGGLFTNDVQKVRRGIPFLKDLPWWVFGLRYLFGYDEDKVTKKELIIILQARIVPSIEDRVARKLTEIREGQRVLERESIRQNERRDQLLDQLDSARVRQR